MSDKKPTMTTEEIAKEIKSLEPTGVEVDFFKNGFSVKIKKLSWGKMSHQDEYVFISKGELLSLFHQIL